MASERIKIFVTGGTFDKQYNELTGELFFQDTHTHGMLKPGRCLLNIDIETLMMIDSLRMTDSDRALIRDRCSTCPERRIVITHGTDTMEQTAAVLGSAIRGKTIVVTGAMVPYQFGSSDGIFNLGTALAFAQALEPGVYVAMNGRCFPWHSVRKNRERGVFEWRDPESKCTRYDEAGSARVVCPDRGHHSERLDPATHAQRRTSSNRMYGQCPDRRRSTRSLAQTL